MSLILCVLLILSATFSSVETALFSLPKFRIKKLIQSYPRWEKFFTLWLTQPESILITVLTGNTFVNTFYSVVLTFFLFTLLVSFPPRLVEIISLLIGTLSVLVLGEITPKIFARRYPELVCRYGIKVINIFYHLFTPLLSLTTILTRVLTGNLKNKVNPNLTQEEIVSIVNTFSTTEQNNYPGTEERIMLGRILRLGELTVEQIMTPWNKVEKVEIAQPEENFFDIIVESGRTRIPIYRYHHHRLIGFLHTKDLLQISQDVPAETKLSVEHYLRPIYFIPPDKKVKELLTEFKKGYVHLAVVVDSLGNLMGLVTLEDILEELVGEILDEYDLEGKKTVP